MRSYICRVRLIEHTAKMEIEAPDIRKAACEVRHLYPHHMGFSIEEA